MRNAVERGFLEKIKALSHYIVRYFNSFLTQTPCSSDEGKLQNLTSTIASTAKLTTSSRRQVKCKKKIRESKLE